MSDQPDTASLVAQIIDGLEPGTFVTQFVLVAEVINTDGERGVWTQTHDDAKRWDTYGLLTEALMCEKAAHMVDRMDEDG